ncbi:protein Wnt-5-like, partial [Rhagoletis pomonella]|uniref:protein Wnt-5-like n=1 Tax=Rhagoletis pomonella TaxID=28610 RepID=UPI00177FFBC2
MVKMEFLKRKHFSLWIITTFVLVAGILDGCVGLQGVPTWICLGIKSPFIEFSNNIEVLANNSVPLNITKDEQALMHQEGLRKLGSFIKPVDLRDSTTGFVKADLTKKIPNFAASTSSNMHYGAGGGHGGGGGGPGGGIIMAQRRRHPIQEEMDQKQIILLDEDTDENGLPTSLTDEDRKFIVPMALKNASPDPHALMATQRLVGMTTRRTTTTTTTTTTKRPTTPVTPEFASNIDDLKKHILFLQNLTKHDSNFQSKFVVFPSLQKDRKNPGPTVVITTTTARPFRSIFQYSAPATPPTRKSAFPSGAKLPGGQPFGGYYHNDDVDDGGMSVFLSKAGMNAREKITIVPQVLLLNDQTSKNETAGGDVRQRNFDNSPAGMPQTIAATTTTTPETTTPMTSTTPKRPTKRPLCIRNPDSPKCIRQRKREEQQRQRHREQLLREQREYLRPHYEPYIQTLNNTKRFAVSIEIPDSFKIPYNESRETTPTPSMRADEGELQLLSRSIRSHHKRRNIGAGIQGRRASNNDKFAAKYGPSYLERDAVITGNRDFVVSSGDRSVTSSTNNSSTPSPTVPAYSEPIDLNPDNCYLVDGMTYGQKKQCVLHTSVMPAISRGARAAIQECQFQFKNRRWNCSTTDDNTVFGPITGLGSPEMAFIHALAAAMVTSFIARACRDGQLASCGCSRGSRPKQLHDDWTWGGCGDNLEYAYKFATDFIDVREKETRRGTRGAGNPERKRGGGRFHQRRNQQMQAMQADDASAVGATTTGRTSAVTTTTTMPTVTTTTSTKSESSRTSTTTQLDVLAGGAAGSTTNEHINSDNKAKDKDNIQQQQLNSNKTAGVDGYNNKNNTQTVNNTNMSTTTTLTGSKDTVTQPTKDPPATATQKSSPSRSGSNKSNNKQESNRNADSYEDDAVGRIKAEDLLELQERIAKEILNSKLQGKEMLELQEKINREILNTKVFNIDAGGGKRKRRRRKNQRAVNGMANDQQADANVNGAGGDGVDVGGGNGGKWRNSITAKARSLMNLHNNEAGRRAVIKKTRITCKCHGVSGSCSLITCWQQLSSIREIGDYLREKYEESTEVKLNKRGRLQVK